MESVQREMFYVENLALHASLGDMVRHVQKLINFSIRPNGVTNDAQIALKPALL